MIVEHPFATTVGIFYLLCNLISVSGSSNPESLGDEDPYNITPCGAGPACFFRHQRYGDVPLPKRSPDIPPDYCPTCKCNGCVLVPKEILVTNCGDEDANGLYTLQEPTDWPEYLDFEGVCKRYKPGSGQDFHLDKEECDAAGDCEWISEQWQTASGGLPWYRKGDSKYTIWGNNLERIKHKEWSLTDKPFRSTFYANVEKSESRLPPTSGWKSIISDVAAPELKYAQSCRNFPNGRCDNWECSFANNKVDCECKCGGTIAKHWAEFGTGNCDDCQELACWKDLATGTGMSVPTLFRGWIQQVRLLPSSSASTGLVGLCRKTERSTTRLAAMMTEL